MKSSFFPKFILSLLVSIFSSCKRDEASANKIQKQDSEIARLRGEIAIIEEEINNFPPDVGAILEESKKINKRQSEEIANLEKDIFELDKRKNDLQNQYEIYRAKYKIK